MLLLEKARNWGAGLGEELDKVPTILTEGVQSSL